MQKYSENKRNKIIGKVGVLLESGMSKKAACEKVGIGFPTYSYWMNKIPKTDNKIPVSSGKIATTKRTYRTKAPSGVMFSLEQILEMKRSGLLK